MINGCGYKVRFFFRHCRADGQAEFFSGRLFRMGEMQIPEGGVGGLLVDCQGIMYESTDAFVTQEALQVAAVRRGQRVNVEYAGLRLAG